MRPYVIAQGDYLSQLAARFGFDATTVWGHPANRELAALRRNPDMLLPGDVLQIPEPRAGASLSVQAQTTNRFRARVPRVTVAVVFRDHGRPIANARYEIRGVTFPPGTSNGDGKVEVRVPVTIREFEVYFPEQRRSFLVCVGHMDPLDEQSGLRQRLQHLGHMPLWLSAADGSDAFTRAIRKYQRAAGLPETGIADEATRAQMKVDHGS
jgi:hypothetical protein